MIIDHLVYGCRDLPAAVADIESLLGVSPVAGGQHLGWGTRNYLVRLGERTYLEIIGPDDDQGDPISPRPFEIDELDEDRLVGWAVSSDDIETDLARLDGDGLDLGPAYAMERTVPGGPTLRWRLTAPTAGLVPMVIDWGDSPHPAGMLPPACELAELRIEAVRPAETKPVVDLFGVDVSVRRGFEDRLAATIDAPSGRVVLW